MRLLTLIFLLLSLSTGLAQMGDQFALLLPPDLTGQADAVVRLDSMAVEVVAVDEMNITHVRTVTVLNEMGNRHAHTYTGYSNSNKIKQIEAVYFDALGNEKDKIRKKDFKDVSAVDGGTLYSDARILYYDYTPVQYPYTVRFTYSINTRNTWHIPAWYFIDGYRVSTEKSCFQISYTDPELKPEFKEHHLGNLDIQRKLDATSVSYTASHIPAIKQEDLSPAFRRIAPRISARLPYFNCEGYRGRIGNWNEMGRWIYHNLLQGRQELSLATVRKMRSLVSGVTDTLQRARIIYNYVQKNTRYISVQVGIGGLQPISALEVDNVKYGDCKGLSNYTQALLQSVGVKAYYTHVESGMDKVDFEEDFSTLAQGDHVILAIPYQGKYYWIDCTSQTHPFGFIGDFTDDRKVLMITPEGGELVRTVAYSEEDSYQFTDAHYALDPAGKITADVTITTEGIQYDSRHYLERQSEEDRLKHYRKYWHHINNLRLMSQKHNNDREGIIFTEQLTLEAEKYGGVSGNRIFFSPNAFNRNTFVPDKYKSRELPFEIQRGYLDEDAYTIALPQGYAIEAMGKTEQIENEFGHYRLQLEYHPDDHTVTYKRSFYLKEGRYPKEKYEQYRDFRKAVAGLDNAQMVLKNNRL